MVHVHSLQPQCPLYIRTSNVSFGCHRNDTKNFQLVFILNVLFFSFLNRDILMNNAVPNNYAGAIKEYQILKLISMHVHNFIEH